MGLFTAAQRFSDGDRLDVAGCPVRLKVDGRARRISLRVDRARSEVVALAPTPRRLSEAVAFAHAKSAWIAGQLAALPGRIQIAPGGTLRLYDRAYRLEDCATPRPHRRRPHRRARRRQLGPEDHPPGQARIRPVLTERTIVHADALGRPTPSVAVADPKARWGSCRPARPGAPAAIRYSWRLILAPAAVADYVVAHECAHLIEANHGPKFWALCERLVGDPAPHRAWLRAHAAELHAISA